ncbi:molybdenum cofactor biosynthesis protein MoaE [Aureimonas sp. AU4]|uniref:molybdenum cofactor biosynthesis protein MoaE n=1 Tax=Aureimonas sp. AU4 TaxID=1638163 RepID=UPI0009E8EB28
MTVLSAAVTGGRIDIAEETRLATPRGEAGAVVTFLGFCRDEGGRLAALELEHYPGMAEREIERILREAAERWPLLAARCVHRHGRVRPGEEIVFLACASTHRQAAFEAAEFVMDFMKTRAPFWKREHLIDGTVGEWVTAKDTDDHSASRWHRL